MPVPPGVVGVVPDGQRRELRHQTTGYGGMAIPRSSGSGWKSAGCWRNGRKSRWSGAAVGGRFRKRWPLRKALTSPSLLRSKHLPERRKEQIQITSESTSTCRPVTTTEPSGGTAPLLFWGGVSSSLLRCQGGALARAP